MFYAISWHDENFDLIEWDIRKKEDWENDSRCGPAVMDVIENGDGCYAHYMGDFLCVEDDVFLGDGAEEIGSWKDSLPVVFILIAGPFYTDVEAQYYVDSQVLPEDDDW